MKTNQFPPTVRAIERMLVEGFAGGDLSIVDELCHPDLVEHQFGLRGVGEEAKAKIRQAMLLVHGAFPDLSFTIGAWTQDDDTTWVRAEGVATNTGPFLAPPSGRPVEFTVVDVARFADGRIVEHWGVPDRFALSVQTGLLDEALASHLAHHPG
ncbi:ester cyclase [Agromyces aerolatus]|uniref:ester cyclase n=1 Tax=Agromyces sp. LY-1074 TaxID=3074080 RepID=UPI002858846F|nr:MULTISPECIES: ester cyclase [unclassified Agromyces]MDR5700220.1 ester cyclase [Agromyces sp. LY-1074]MDR5706412.1 ester cyclase [Agromyces sp. LY-1358]